MPDRELRVVALGTMAYGDALELQRAVARGRIAGEIEQDLLLLVEHPPVVTLGRTANAAHLRASRQLLAARGVELFDVERGGDVTFHGPGQLVGYPVIDLKRHREDLHWYLRRVEDALIRTLASFHIAGRRIDGYTGVWTGERKIASIGVHARDWVTWHGFALNVTTNLAYFDLIVPCGITGVQMTSIARELGHGVPMRDVETAAAKAFGATLALEPVATALDDVLRYISPACPMSRDTIPPVRAGSIPSSHGISPRS